MLNETLKEFQQNQLFLFKVNPNSNALLFSTTKRPCLIGLLISYAYLNFSIPLRAISVAKIKCRPICFVEKDPFIVIGTNL